MLIEFSVGNYKSFKDIVTFSMVAANITSKDKKIDENNVFSVNSGLKLLKSAAIYGANASGKSNLANAIRFMKWFMVNSSKETQSNEEIEVENFKLSSATERAPSFFEIVFVFENQRYRYGFEVTSKRVVSEWLFYVPKVKETRLFERDFDDIKATKNYGAETLKKMTRSNALFLSVSAQFNVEIAEKVIAWITSELGIISGLHDRGYREYTAECLFEDRDSKEILGLVKNLDLGIGEIKVEQKDLTLDAFPKALPDEIKNFIIEGTEGKAVLVNTVHSKFDENNKHVSDVLFSLDRQESEGTQKIFALAGPLVDTLKCGMVIIIDEFDARLHPIISRAIVELFNSKETNPNNAQLILMTHDTNLLNNKIFRRDQIWFTEKDRYGATDLYSLAEYRLPEQKGVRNDASYESDYIKGRYGAIPYIGNIKHLIES
jgi:hypothetical protein